MTEDVLKQEAEQRGKSLNDTCTYDELFNLLLKVYDNCRETITFELDNILLSMNLKKGK